MLFIFSREAIIITFVRDKKVKVIKNEDKEISEETNTEQNEIEKIKQTATSNELIVIVKRTGKIEKITKKDWEEIVKIGNEDKFEVK
jgi:E3 ubiquitin-protein ligase DOA10